METHLTLYLRVYRDVKTCDTIVHHWTTTSTLSASDQQVNVHPDTDQTRSQNQLHIINILYTGGKYSITSNGKQERDADHGVMGRRINPL